MYSLVFWNLSLPASSWTECQHLTTSQMAHSLKPPALGHQLPGWALPLMRCLCWQLSNSDTSTRSGPSSGFLPAFLGLEATGSVAPQSYRGGDCNSERRGLAWGHTARARLGPQPTPSPCHCLCPLSSGASILPLLTSHGQCWKPLSVWQSLGAVVQPSHSKR